MDANCIDQIKFLNLPDTFNLAKNVNQSTHLHGHILDPILNPSDSSLVNSVAVGDLVSDHALVKCHLDFACPAIPEVDIIFYRRYQGVFPQKFKKVVDTPLMKKASLSGEDLLNYRPVSGICFMSKLVEG